MAKTYKYRKNNLEDGARAKKPRPSEKQFKKKKYPTHEILDYEELDYEQLR